MESVEEPALARPLDLLPLIASGDFEGATAIVESFQANPLLLDPTLASCVGSLASSVDCSDDCLQLIYVFTKVRGHKVVSRFLPNSVHNLVPLTERIETSCETWQSRYVLLLWISVVLLSPFKIELWGPDFFNRLFAIATRWIVVNGKERDAASMVLARLVSRSREQESMRLRQLIDWAGEIGPMSGSKSIGLLQTLAIISKSADLTPSLQKFMVVDAAKSTMDTNSTKSKLLLKIYTRQALLQSCPVELIEEAVGYCMEGLKSSYSTVRMTAAKHLARIAMNMTSMNEPQEELAHEIYEYVMQLLKGPVVVDTEWQGSLLAIAEFARSGFDLSPWISEVIEIIRKALYFNQRRIRVSVGASVRDTACYVCWAMFRSPCSERYLTMALRQRLYQCLTALACFDREINIRRAAAAAVQEGMGRQPQGADSSDLQYIQMVNFQSVTLISDCYLNLAPKVISTPEQLSYLISHGVGSFDASMRRLASSAVALLDIDETSLAQLRTWAAGDDPDLRHGSLLALSKLNIANEKWLTRAEYSSDLYCESALTQLSLLPTGEAVTEAVLKCMRSDNSFVLQAAETFAANLAADDVARSYILRWNHHRSESPSYVAAISAAPRTISERETCLLNCCQLPDPKSRVLAIRGLHSVSTPILEVFYRAIDDYQSDKRGDVGSWVREAAVNRICEQWNEYPEPWRQKLEPKIWRVAAERSDRVRNAAALFLAKHQLILEYDVAESSCANEQYFCSLLSSCRRRDQAAQQSMIRGLVSTVGAQKVSTSLLNSALSALGKYIQDADGDWVYNFILHLESSHCLDVTSTLSRLLEIGVISDNQQVLGIATKATMRTSNVFVIKSAITILGWLSPEFEGAQSRLLSLCSHPMPIIRKMASEALFEAGISVENLVKTDWTDPSYSINSEKQCKI